MLTRKASREMERPLVCDCAAREVNSARRLSNSCFEKALRGGVSVRLPDKVRESPGDGGGKCEWGTTWRP